MTAKDCSCDVCAGRATDWRDADETDDPPDPARDDVWIIKQEEDER